MWVGERPEAHEGVGVTAAILTMRQRAVAILVSQGYTDKQIADELEIAENTVGNHITAIAKALDIDKTRNTRVQITLRLYQIAA